MIKEKYILLLLLIVIVLGCANKPAKKTISDETVIAADNKDHDLQIIDISQKQLALYNEHLNTDSAERKQIFRDSLYYPYKKIWDRYLGKIETFDAVAEHYGIRIIDELNEKNKLFYSGSKNETLLDAFFEVREGMIELTGHSPKGEWYLFYGPSVANLGSVGEGVMFVDFGFPGNNNLPSVINWFPHELNHQIFGNLNKDTANHALEVCINEGFAVYVNKLYWNTIGGKKDYSIAMSLEYSEEELVAAEQEWNFILSYFKENYLADDQNIKNSFESRRSKLKEDLPGAIGYLIGYKIVEDYVRIYGPDSWKDIYTLGFEELLEKSELLKF
ncbi:MAG: hypothetical protein HOD64_07855 [Candidatus Cloacimonetes bacterium]|jgi:hypothetical protein|nr:hypothetical protein [Candidatus Cloacimonadota bacterium]MBT4333177.1 hypothetical protein [Candidatus Cloacimonadota bacterium]MBT4576491.1 hypothetical protein [Candidatus Cloacimonadota bacterium]